MFRFNQKQKPPENAIIQNYVNMFKIIRLKFHFPFFCSNLIFALKRAPNLYLFKQLSQNPLVIVNTNVVKNENTLSPNR